MIDFDNLLLAPVHDAFGEPVLYYPGAGGTLQVTGVFTEKYASAKFLDDTQVAGVSPMLNVRTSLFAPFLPCQGELFRILERKDARLIGLVDPAEILRLLAQGMLYQVTSPEPDGLGDMKILLRAATDDEAARLLLRP